MSRAKKALAISELPMDKLVQVENSRLVYSEHTIAEMMISMKQSGLLQPIGVRPHGKNYEIVFGNRRFLAAQKLGWKTIPVVLVDAPQDEQMIVLNAIENMQRESVPPQEQGRLFQVLIDQGMTADQIAARIGVGTLRVKECIGLFNSIPESAHHKVLAGSCGKKKVVGKIPATTAFGLARFIQRFNIPKNERAKLVDFAAKKGVTHQHITAVGNLFSAGLPLEQALERAQEYIIVNLTIPVLRENAEALEAEEERTIHDIIKLRVSKMKDLGVLLGNSKRKTWRRKQRSAPRSSRYFPAEAH